MQEQIDNFRKKKLPLYKVIVQNDKISTTRSALLAEKNRLLAEYHKLEKRYAIESAKIMQEIINVTDTISLLNE